MNTINHFLELTAKEVKTLLGVVCAERMHLDDQVGGRERGRRLWWGQVLSVSVCVLSFQFLPARGSAHYLSTHGHKLKGKQSKAPISVVVPGEESHRRAREDTVR